MLVVFVDGVEHRGDVPDAQLVQSDVAEVRDQVDPQVGLVAADRVAL